MGERGRSGSSSGDMTAVLVEVIVEPVGVVGAGGGGGAGSGAGGGGGGGAGAAGGGGGCLELGGVGGLGC